MPLRQIKFIPTEFYHIYNRGNGRQNIFYDDRDRYRFLQAMYLSNNEKSFIGIPELERNKSSYTLIDIKKMLDAKNIIQEPFVRIIADCLMPNHFHFLVEENKENGITNFMQKLGTSYGKYFSIKYDRPGSIFQGRFKAVHIKNDDQLKYLLAYINIINPAQLIEPELKENGIESFDKVWEAVDKYPWSTHFEFTGKRKSILVDKGILNDFFPTQKIYSDFMKEILHGKIRNIWKTIENLTID